MQSAMGEELRQFFKVFNRFMLLQWRLGLGRWLNAFPSILGRYLVIVHTGRKSGMRRYTPVNFGMWNGELYVTAGFGSISDWYRNILANPQVEVWMPNGWWSATAEDVTSEPEFLLALRQVLIGSAFAAELAGVHPRTMSDEELAKATTDYRLIHLTLKEPRTGDGGPGDLSWVWTVMAVMLLFIRRPARRRHHRHHAFTWQHALAGQHISKRQRAFGACKPRR